MVTKVGLSRSSMRRKNTNTSQPKAAPAAPATSSSKEPATPAPAVPASTPAPPAAPAQTSSSNTPAVPATPTPAGTGAAQPASGSLASAGSTIGAERTEAIANLESMGFARPEIEVAMRAAYFNADRAVEYLLNVRESFTNPRV